MTITIKTDNAAFADGNREAEIARILRDIADKIERGAEPKSARDYNGNTVATIRGSQRAMKPQKLTIADIEQWIDNDEGLHNWWRSSRISKRQFIRDNREELTACINRVLTGNRPAHYLAYGR